MAINCTCHVFVPMQNKHSLAYDHFKQWLYIVLKCSVRLVAAAAMCLEVSMRNKHSLPYSTPSVLGHIFTTSFRCD